MNRRAEYLGSNPLSVLVRCPCGRRNYFTRADWRRRGVAVCQGCGTGILHGSLQTVSPREAERMAQAHTPTETELQALYHVEQMVRDFLKEYGEQPRWLWAPATTRMAEQLRPLLAALDEAREGRPSPLPETEPADGQDEVTTDDGAPADEGDGDEDGLDDDGRDESELFDEQG